MPRRLIRRWLPDARTVRESRALRWLGPLLERPWLWRFTRRSVALGLAAGMFFGLLLPFAQSLFSGAFAVVLRANLPAAVLATFVSNPVTTPGIVVAGYYVGTLALGLPFSPPGEEAGLPWSERISSMGEPLLAGLLIVASLAALLTYVGVLVAWRVSARLRLARMLRNPEGGRS